MSHALQAAVLGEPHDAAAIDAINRARQARHYEPRPADAMSVPSGNPSARVAL